MTDAVTVVVLAGGTSSRFGRDKLAAAYAGSDLLTTAVGSLDPGWAVVVVGPERDVGRPVTWVREDPPGSGPAAALLTGLRATRTATVITLPGDSLRAGVGATRLIEALAGRDAVVAADDRPNPLWLGLQGAALDRARALDPVDWADRSARSLVDLLGPEVVAVPAAWLADVDLPSDLASAARPEPT